MVSNGHGHNEILEDIIIFLGQNSQSNLFYQAQSLCVPEVLILYADWLCRRRWEFTLFLIQLLLTAKTPPKREKSHFYYLWYHIAWNIQCPRPSLWLCFHNKTDERGKREQDKSIILVTGRQSMSLIIKTSELYKCIFELREAFFFLNKWFFEPGGCKEVKQNKLWKVCLSEAPYTISGWEYRWPSTESSCQFLKLHFYPLNKHPDPGYQAGHSTGASKCMY